MAVYGIFLNEPDGTEWEALRKQWPGGRSFVLTDHLAFVAPDGIALTGDIAETLGIGDAEERLGVVFELGAHNGYNDADLWEWIKKVQRS